MKLGYTILYVENVPDTIAFYEKAFGLEKKFIHESMTYGEMNTGSTTLSFVSKDSAKESHIDFGQLTAAPGPFELAFVTADVETAFDKAITNGCQKLKSPEQKPWGQVVSYVKDCNGFLIEICSPIG